MDFKIHVETIAKWIESCKKQDNEETPCDTRAALNLCRDAIDQFVEGRFKNHIDSKTLSLKISELKIQIMDIEREFEYR